MSHASGLTALVPEADSGWWDRAPPWAEKNYLEDSFFWWRHDKQSIFLSLTPLSSGD